MTENNDIIQQAIRAAQERKAAKEAGLAAPQTRIDVSNIPMSKFVRRAKVSKKTVSSPAAAPKHIAQDKAGGLVKLHKAAAKLPEISADLQEIYNTVVARDINELIKLAAHINHHIREVGTVAATSKKEHDFRVGETVKIVTGHPLYVGFIGKLEKISRIRCYVKLDDVEKPVYLFISDIEKCSSNSTVEDNDQEEESFEDEQNEQDEDVE